MIDPICRPFPKCYLISKFLTSFLWDAPISVGSHIICVVLLLGFSFLAGLATIAAPCVWPVLPVVLSSSVKGGRLRPLGVVSGIVTSFAFFTLSLSYLVRVFEINPNTFRYIAVVILLILGTSFVIPKLSYFFEVAVSRLTASFGSELSLSGGSVGGFVTGLALGVVWTPCAGPILAAIATLAGTGQVNGIVVAMTVAYSVGAGMPLLVLAVGGQRILTKTKALSPITPVLQKVFGIIIVLTAVAIYFGYDKVLSAKLLDVFPALVSFSTRLESSAVVSQELNNLTGQKSSLPNSGKASELLGATNWINSPPLTLKSLRGKVVLVDFWTYTCINCIRTLPYLVAWYDKYHSSGLEIIGVHTPEFEFEKDTSNVQSAVAQFGIKYPVAQDNSYTIWNNFHNQYWPAEYLIDTNGNIRKTDFGEGNYDEMEKAIQALLSEAGRKADSGTVGVVDQTPRGQMNFETYLGSDRSEFYYPDGTTPAGERTFVMADTLPQGAFGLGGDWTVTTDHLISGTSATLRLNFQAGKVYLVMRPPTGGIGKVKVLIDGKELTGSDSGKDVIGGEITVDSDRLYTIFDHRSGVLNHLLELQFETLGTQSFVFTFG